MKITSKISLIVGTLLVSQAALADGRDDHQENKQSYSHGSDYSERYSDRRHDRRHDRKDRRHNRRENHHEDRGYNDHNYGKHRNKHRARDVLRLDIPVHVRGSARIPLRQAIRSQYDIDLTNYRLRKVVVDNYGQHRGYAKLQTGHRNSGRVALNNGRTHVRAPRYTDGRWNLKLRHARVDNIRVVLEPRHRVTHSRRAHDENSRPWFNAGVIRW